MYRTLKCSLHKTISSHHSNFHASVQRVCARVLPLFEGIGWWSVAIASPNPYCTITILFEAVTLFKVQKKTANVTSIVPG
eukprot:m.191509 g.191509  ORF g.191509 m.191509 type:complete len:80 (+) comp14844_c1_seq1:854-1093(+)